ncbi:hypothetical protein [Ruegeria arenilitoris]|uniref:hypothetical protein n=1 Tax=Ruegeria arenilitoris TaxID=1173585 RepID=UPI0020C25570|nr:hypothetical protein [Ruegeria arenilitoris]
MRGGIDVAFARFSENGGVGRERGEMLGQMGCAGRVRVVIRPRKNNQLNIHAVEVVHGNHICRVQPAFLGKRNDALCLGGSGKNQKDDRQEKYGGAHRNPLNYLIFAETPVSRRSTKGATVVSMLAGCGVFFKSQKALQIGVCF